MRRSCSCAGNLRAVFRRQKLTPGSHHIFLARVEAVDIDEDRLDENGKFELNRAGLAAYSHGEYFALGRKLGSFGFSVRRKEKR